MVDILMATYNGEKYLEEQLKSILAQTYSEWNLYIRDDCSKDGTVKIIEEYQNTYPQKIHFIKDNKKSLGAKGNFAELVRYSTSSYVMFSDQDDVWLNNKIERTLNKMKEFEDKYGCTKPLLIHTDLTVVDKELNIISKSFWNLMKLNPKKNTLNYLMVENIVTGCTVMMNSSLLKAIGNIPSDCFIHDWWIAILASSIGKIGRIEDSTILYRQHERNEVGARREKFITKLKNKIKKISKVSQIRNKTFSAELNQMKSFYNTYKNNLNPKERDLITSFITIYNHNAIVRKYIIIKNRIFVHDIFSNIKNMISV